MSSFLLLLLVFTSSRSCILFMLSSNKDEVKVLIERLSTKELLAKSLKELAQTKPIDKITIKDITDNCGLSKRTLYHNFQDKAELVLFEYSLNLSKVFNAENKDLSWLELMHRAIMAIVNNYDYYRNAFHVFDYSSSPIKAMKLTASSTFEDFIKLKTEIKELTEEEKIALKIYTFGIWAYGIEWTKNGMPISVEKLAQYYVNSMPYILHKYLI